MDNKFSIRILPEKARIYKCNKDEYKNIIEKYKLYNDDDILCRTILVVDDYDFPHINFLWNIFTDYYKMKKYRETQTQSIYIL